MLQAFLDLTDDEAETALVERSRGLCQKILQLPHGDGVLNASSFSHRRKIRLSGSGGWVADSRAAVGLIVEHKNRQIGGIQMSQGWKIK